MGRFIAACRRPILDRSERPPSDFGSETTEPRPKPPNGRPAVAEKAVRKWAASFGEHQEDAWAVIGRCDISAQGESPLAARHSFAETQ
jgi:hypothetical protein